MGSVQDSAAMLRWPRVCVVGNFPPPGAGGLPSQGELLAHQLEGSGASVTLLSTHRTRPARLVDVMTHLMGTGRRWDTYCIQVFTFRATVVEMLALLAGKLWRRRTVLVMRDGRLIQTLDRWPALAAVYRRADAIVFPSEYLAQGLKHHRLEGFTIPNVISLERYPFRPRERLRPRLLFMRTFHPLYNPLLALHTFQIIKARYADAELTLAGMDRNYMEEVQRVSRAMGLDGVYFMGFVDKERVPALMGEHDIYLNTPHIDNTPVSVLEALACGLPVVATRVGGVPYLLADGENALLVPDDDAQAMARAVQRLLEDPGLAGHLSRRGRLLAESFTWENVREAWRAALTGPLSCEPANA